MSAVEPSMGDVVGAMWATKTSLRITAASTWDVAASVSAAQVLECVTKLVTKAVN